MDQNLPDSRRPNLFIIGLPKCGTTSLANWLGQHSAIYAPAVKEPHFFNTDHNYVLTNSIKDYEALYATAPDSASFRLDASVYYAMSKVAIPSILEYSPDARFILCVREPRSMMVSLFHQQRRVGFETLATFEEMWRQHDERLNRGELPGLCPDLVHLDYRSTCAIGDRASQVASMTPSGRLLIVNMDELKEDPDGVLNRIFCWLDLSKEPIETRVLNRARERRFSWMSPIMTKLVLLRRQLGFEHGFGILNALDRRMIVERGPAEIDPKVDAELRAFSEVQMQRLKGIEADLEYNP